MPLQIIRNDITKVECDAIVNAANRTLLGGGGVDGAIHKAAGKKLLAECMTLHGCKTGEAKITKGYNLPAKYVIHTVGPVWHGGNNGEKEKLISCYKSSLALAKEYGCESVAFPLISSGVYGYPIAEAFAVAVDTIADFLMQNDMLVYVVVYNNTAVLTGTRVFGEITQYIDDNYVAEQMPLFCQQSVVLDDMVVMPSAAEPNLESIIDNTLDESFSEMLLRKIDESGMADSQCYKKANIDKRSVI